MTTSTTSASAPKTSPFTTGTSSALNVPSAPAASRAAAPTTDHPGRWVGGAIGAAVSLLAALISTQVGDAISPVVLPWTMVGLLGMPVGFVLGRELLPMARGAGWGRALSTGMLLGWAAPPLGAIEILACSRLLDFGNLSTIGGPIALVLLPVAIPVSFVAIFMTLPIGIAWGVFVRLVPTEALVALRVPRPLERLGVRHAVIAIGVALLLVEIAVRS